MRFTWDEAKSVQVANDHKVEFTRIIDIFDDPYSVDFVDEIHSTADEARYAIIALTAAYGLTFLVYTEPETDEIHFITARRAESWMVKDYEENSQGQ